MCRVVLVMYTVATRCYYAAIMFFQVVEELGVELEVVADSGLLEDFEILAPISVELFFNRV